MAHWRYKFSIKDTFVEDPYELNEEEVNELAKKLSKRIDTFINTLSANNEIRYELGDISWEFEQCTTVDEIDATLDMMYDICDANRIWVE